MNITVLLEGCQIVQERSLLEYLPSLHFSDCYHRSGGNTLVCRFRHILVLELLRVDELPVPVVPFQHYMQLPVWCGDEVTVLLEACAYHGKGRCLYPSDGVVHRTGGCRQCAAGIHAHQPIRLRPAVRGCIQAVISGSFLEACHSLTDGLVGKRGDPQPFERLGTAQIRIYPPEDEFPLTSGIGRHDDALASGEHFADDLELPAGCDVRHHPPVSAYLPHDKTERIGNHRKVFGGGSRVAVCIR